MKKYGWQIVCCTLLIIIFILSYQRMQNKEAVQSMIERTVYGDLVFLHYQIDYNAQNNWKDADVVESALITMNNSSLEVNILLQESNYSFEEVEEIIIKLYHGLLPYPMKLTGTKEGQAILLQLHSYLEEAKITNDQSIDINYEERIKRLEHLLKLLKQNANN